MHDGQGETPLAIRDEKGKYLKGRAQGRPLGSKNKPPFRNLATKMLAAIVEDAYTPEELSLMVQETYNLALKKEDWKGMYSVVALILAYSIGKPVQRSLTAQIDPEDIKRMFRPQEGEGEGEEYIEVE